MYGFIYITTNNINGMRYIGQKQYDKRGNWKTYLGSGVYLKRAIGKYGKENFTREIIEECKNKEDLDLREIYWINHYNAVSSNEFYNIAKGGDGGNTFVGFTDEQMKLHSLKQSKSKKGIINQGKNNPMSKQVICLNNMKIFDTTIEAAKYANVKDYMIQECCRENSKTKTAGTDIETGERLQWKYYDPNVIYEYKPFKRDINNISKKVICIELGMTFNSMVEGAKYIGKTKHTLWCHLNGYAKSCGKSVNGEKLHWKYA